MARKRTHVTSPTDLLLFLDEDEQADLLARLKVQAPTELKSFSVTEILLETVRQRGPFIRMMAEIGECLERLDIYIKGKLEVVSLPSSGRALTLSFGPQLRGYIALALDQELLLANYEHLRTCMQECETAVNSLIQRLKPRFVKRVVGQGRQLQNLARQLGPAGHKYQFIVDHSFTHRRLEYSFLDAKGMGDLSQALTSMVRVASRETQLHSSSHPEDEMVGRLRKLAAAAQRKAGEVSATQGNEYPSPRPTLSDADYKHCLRQVARLREVIAASSRRERSTGGMLDFMGLEIWKERWRIYEIWLLSKVILILLDHGLRPLQTERLGSGVWHLRYSKDEKPALELSYGGFDVHVYYQLYRRRDSGGDMPDIAVEIPGQGFLLVLDPKHGRTYRSAELWRVCNRYADAFNALNTCVANYFETDSRAVQAETHPRRLVACGVAPGSAALEGIEEAMRATLYTGRQRWIRSSTSVVVLFDVSESTARLRGSMLEKVRRKFEAATVAEGSVFLPFAETTQEAVPLAALDQVEVAAHGGGGGTNFDTAFREAFELIRGMAGPREIWLCSDGDGTVDHSSVIDLLLKLGVVLELIQVVGEAPGEAFETLSGLELLDGPGGAQEPGG